MLECSVLTAKAASGEAVRSQRAGCIERVCVDEEGEDSAEDEEGSAGSKRSAT